MTKRINISVQGDVLSAFDAHCGLIPRSAAINALMKREIAHTTFVVL